MTIQLHGKEYVEVKDRVAAAHLEDSYSMLKEETFAMGGREYVRVYIDVRGKQYIGTAECKYNAPPKSPDGMSPFECGETSALGRALGFAGYGVVDSIASADEVVSNQQNGNRQPAAQPPQKPLTNGDGTEAVPAINPTVVRMIEIAKKRALDLGVDWDLFKVSTLGGQVHDSKLGMHHFSKINGELTRREKAAQVTAAN